MMIVKLQGETERCQGVYYEFDIHSKPLGIGGMGKVYLGSKVVISTGARIPVAIKAMFEDATESVIERARREASIQLKHDNLVEMMGFVETNDMNSLGGCIKHYHVISEYINGVMLSDFLCGMTKNQYGEELEAAQRLYGEYTTDRIATSIRIIKQVLSGVMALHDKGYIHRDIDPSNIMVTADGNVKLIDFGIAKMLKTLGTNDKNLTATGAFIGKAQYAAPELVTGDVPHQNATTDLYSIGILFYQLITGKLPFVGPTHTVLDAQLHKNIPLKDVHNIDCKKVIAKATRKNQSLRYQSSAAFRVDLDKIKIDNNHVVTKVAVGAAILAACIAILLVWKYWERQEIDVPDNNLVEKQDISSDTDVKNDTINHTNVKPDSEQATMIGIDKDIARAINVNPTEYERIIAIANRYYHARTVSEADETIGRNVLNTAKGKSLLGKNNNYSNVKVAFVIFKVTQDAARKSGANETVGKCDKYLKEIYKHYGL